MPASGGSTTQSGIYYQNTIAALFLGRMLNPRISDKAELVTEVRVEAPEYVDDVVITFADKHRCFIQAKENITPRPSDEAWRKLWADFEKQRWKPNFGPEDRLVLYLGTLSADFKNLSELCKRAFGAEDLGEWQDILLATQALAKLEGEIRQLLSDEHRNAAGSLELLKSVDVEQKPLDILESLVPAWMPPNNKDEQTLFSDLRDLCGGHARYKVAFREKKLARTLKNSKHIEITHLKTDHRIRITPLIGLVLLPLVFLYFYFSPQIRFNGAMQRLNLAIEPADQVREMANVASLTGLWPLGSQPEQTLAVYFDHISPEKQAALFQEADPSIDLHALICAVYALPPVGDGQDNHSVLEAMHAWLARSEAPPSSLQKELGFWLEGQDLAKQEKMLAAVQKYNQAAVENPRNPAVLLERARLYLQIKQYNQALKDGEAALAAANEQFPREKPPANPPDNQKQKNPYIPIQQRFENALQTLLADNGKLQAYLRTQGQTTYPRLFPLLPAVAASDAAFEITLRWTGKDDLDLWAQLEDGTLIDPEHPRGPEGARSVNDVNPGCVDSSSTGEAQETIAWYGSAVPANFSVGVRIAQLCGDQNSQGGIPFEIDVKRGGKVEASYSEKILPGQASLTVARIGNFKPQERAVFSSSDQNSPAAGVDFLEDGRLLLIAAKDISIYDWQENTQPLFTIPPACDKLNSYAVSADWKTLALGCEDGTIEVWSLKVQQKLWTLEAERGGVVKVAVSGKGEYLAYAGSNGQIMVVDLLSRETYPPLVGQQYTVSGLIFTPDGEYLFSAAEDQTIYRWKIDRNQHAVSGGFFAHTNTAPVFLAHDPVSGLLVAGDENGAFTWWNEDTREIHPMAETGGKLVQAIAYSAERHTAALIIGMPEQAINISLMDLQTGSLISEIKNQRGPARALAFLPGGGYLAVGFTNGEVVLWETFLSARTTPITGEK